MVDEMLLNSALEVIAANSNYRVLKRLPKRDVFQAQDASTVRVGIIVDTETTGLNQAADEIIELGMLKFSFSSDGRIFSVTDYFASLREPSVPIPDIVTKLTGITTAMVAGKVIDPAAVASFIADAALVIAHEARFDRPFCERLVPEFAQKYWACSNAEIGWAARGHGGTKLTYLLNDFGYFFDGHRALDDCYAVLHALTDRLPGAADCAFAELLKNARKTTVRVWAEDAPYAHKDALRSRGYRWSPGSDDTRRAWWKDCDDATIDAELAYLKTEIYGKDDLELPLDRITGWNRFSERG